MNKSIIKEFLNGSIGRYDTIKLSNEYKEIETKAFIITDNFIKKLNKEQQELFHETYELICDKNAEYATDHFVEGFKLGLLLGLECK